MSRLTQWGNDLYTGARSFDFVGKRRIWYAIAALFVILAIANEQGIDLEEALGQVLEKYRIRDSDRWERNPPDGQEDSAPSL
jgi:hypothetical protein